MADETTEGTTGRDDASSAAPTPRPKDDAGTPRVPASSASEHDPALDARIVEEVIIKKPHAPQPVAAQPLSATPLPPIAQPQNTPAPLATLRPMPAADAGAPLMPPVPTLAPSSAEPPPPLAEIPIMHAMPRHAAAQDQKPTATTQQAKPPAPPLPPMPPRPIPAPAQPPAARPAPAPARPPVATAPRPKLSSASLDALRARPSEPSSPAQQRPAWKPASAPVSTAKPSAPARDQQQTPPAPVIPPAPKAPEPLKLVPKPPAAPAVAPTRPVPPDIRPRTQPPTPAEAAAPRPSTASSQPTTAPAPRPAPAPLSAPAPATPTHAPKQEATNGAPAEDAALKNNIADILKSVKLPQRRDTDSAPPSQKQIEVKQFDTMLGAGAPTSASAPVPNAAAPGAAPARQSPTPPVAEAAAPEAAERDTKPDIVTPVHTLKDDLQHVVHDQKISVVRAASLEQDRRAKEQSTRREKRSEGERQRTRRVAGTLIAILLLILLGAAALWGVYAVEQARSTTAAASVDTSSILFSENAVSIPIDAQTPDALKQTLAQARTGGGAALGSITQIVPTISSTAQNGTKTTRPATLAEFLSALGANPPSDLLRALSSQFFFGVHTVDTNAPLLVIPVTSYDRAFAGMLDWEPDMDSELAPVFASVPKETTNAQGLPVARTFTDVVMRNYDVRALKDDARTIKLYYSFPSQRILIIAESPYTFTEVLSRLQAQHKL